jgi:hypothetical protein
MRTDIEIINSVIAYQDAWNVPDTSSYEAISAGIPLAAIIEVRNGGKTPYEWANRRIRTAISNQLNKLLSTEPDLAMEYMMRNFALIEHDCVFLGETFKVYEKTDIETYPNLLMRSRSGFLTAKEMNRFCRDTQASANLLASCIVHDLSDSYAALIDQPNFKKNLSKDQMNRIIASLIKSGLQRNALMEEYKLGVPSVSANMAVIIGLFTRAVDEKWNKIELPSSLCGDQFVKEHAHNILIELQGRKFKDPDFVLAVVQDLKRLDVDLVLMAEVLDGGRYAYFDYKDRQRSHQDMTEVLDIAWSWRSIKGMHFCSAFVSVVPVDVIQAHAEADKIFKLRYSVTGEKALFTYIKDSKFKGKALEGALGL